MRTTVDIDDDVVKAAKAIARLRNQSLGRALSDLARRGMMPEPSPRIEIRGGIPVWVHGPGALPVSSELVRNLSDEE